MHAHDLDEHQAPPVLQLLRGGATVAGLHLLHPCRLVRVGRGQKVVGLLGDGPVGSHRLVQAMVPFRVRVRRSLAPRHRPVPLRGTCGRPVRTLSPVCGLDGRVGGGLHALHGPGHARCLGLGERSPVPVERDESKDLILSINLSTTREMKVKNCFLSINLSTTNLSPLISVKR